MSEFATAEDFTREERRYKESRLYNGKKILIRSMTEAEFSRIDIENMDTSRGGLSKDGLRLSNCRVIIATVCDANPDSPKFKQPLFTEKDIATLFKADTVVIQPLIREIREHCGIRQDTEDLVKNFKATTADGSPTSSSERPEREGSTEQT
jgi:hypothetical protein